MIDKHKPDPFDSADYYSCNQDGEDLSHESPEEALAELLDLWGHDMLANAPITVYAWKRKRLPVSWFGNEADFAVEFLVERWGEEYGDPEGDLPGPFDDDFTAKLESLLREHVKPEHVWACERVGSREYSADELREMLADELAELER